MRASLPRLIRALHAEKPPRAIRQESFYGGHEPYKRLCHLKGAEPYGSDLLDYVHTLCYAKMLQQDLLHHLLPLFLEIWRQDLLSNSLSGYGGIVEYFWAALANRPLLQENLTVSEVAAVEAFMADSLLDRIDQERDLSFSGTRVSPYIWFRALSSFAVVFPTLSHLWNRWWEMTTPGQACAVLQYLSCLLYEENKNPVFSPWTPDGGGGPPSLWELEGHIFDHGWRPENVEFVQSTLTTEYVEGKLKQAAQIVESELKSDAPQTMAKDFEAQQTLLELRLMELPSLLLTTRLSHMDWTI